ncbi:MAG: T9SS type A sorting domain-containing protein [Bacteroidetes bacterium]|nr:T9SS type A sorting domain-containing protein [Bacteroidota bacterium]
MPTHGGLMRPVLSFAVFAAAAVLSILLLSVLPAPMHQAGVVGHAPRSGGDTRLTPAERLLHAAQFDVLRTRDPRTGDVPADIRMRERAYAVTLPSRDATQPGGSDVFSRRAGAMAIEWTRRGPTQLAGRMLDIAFDRDDDRVLYAGSASGGFWKSTDRGQHWRKTTAPAQEQIVGCIAQDPRPGHRDILYYGTGELLSTTDRSAIPRLRTSGYGNGIYRSTDRGEHWEALPSTTGATPGSLQSPFQGVWDLEIPSEGWDAGALYAACFGGILRSTDGGESWERVLGDPATPAFCTDLVLTPAISYAAIGGLAAGGGTAGDRGIFFSIDRREWTAVTPPNENWDYRVVELVSPASNPYVLYVLAETANPDPVPHLAFFSRGHTLYKYTHDPALGAGRWDDLTPQLLAGVGSGGFSTLGGYCIGLAVHPQDEDLVFVLGTSLYRSTDGFRTADSVTVVGGYPYNWTINELHPDQHAAAFLPSDPSKLFVANDGGVQASIDNRAADVVWVQRNTDLVSTQFYRVAQDPATANDEFIIGGLQDNATYFSTDASDPAGWEGMIGGDGMSVAVAPGKAFGMASVYSGRIYSFLFLPDGGVETVRAQSNPDGGLFAFFTVFALDPVNGTTLYQGGQPVLWRKEDMAASAQGTLSRRDGWSAVAPATFPAGAFVSAIGCAADASGYVYIGSSEGGLKRVEDARGDTPGAVTLTSPLFPAGAYVSCLAVDPRDSRRVFAVFSNYNVQSVFMTDDAGATWEAVSGNLEEFPDGSGAGPSVRWLAILPLQDGEILFSGTSAGLFSTTMVDGMATVWTRESVDGIGTVCVDHVDARAADGSVIVATQGAGVWSAKVDAVNSTGDVPAPSGLVVTALWPRPAHDHVNVTLRAAVGGFVTVTLHDLRGREVQRRVFSSPIAEHTQTLDVGGLPEGMYILTAAQAGRRYSVRLLKM